MVGHAIAKLTQHIAQMKANVVVIVHQKNMAFDCHGVCGFMAAYCVSIAAQPKRKK
jgi:predicted SpoU family rRNA methylase